MGDDSFRGTKRNEAGDPCDSCRRDLRWRLDAAARRGGRPRGVAKGLSEHGDSVQNKCSDVKGQSVHLVQKGVISCWCRGLHRCEPPCIGSHGPAWPAWGRGVAGCRMSRRRTCPWRRGKEVRDAIPALHAERVAYTAGMIFTAWPVFVGAPCAAARSVVPTMAVGWSSRSPAGSLASRRPQPTPDPEPVNSYLFILAGAILAMLNVAAAIRRLGSTRHTADKARWASDLQNVSPDRLKG